MNLVIIHKHESSTATGSNNLLKSALASAPLAGFILGGLKNQKLPRLGSKTTIYAIPESWGIEAKDIFCQNTGFRFPSSAKSEIVAYADKIPISCAQTLNTNSSAWIAISNGRYATEINRDILGKVLYTTKADIVAVSAERDLLAYQEKVQLTADGRVAGFYRLYEDSIEPVPVPANWPHHIFVRAWLLGRILTEGTVPALTASFTDFLERCRSLDAPLSAVKVAGVEFDLETEEGLLRFCTAKLKRIKKSKLSIPNSDTISSRVKLIDKVLLGKNVQIDRSAIVIGPCIICDDAKVGQGAIISSSVIFRDVEVPPKQLIKNRVVASVKREGTPLCGNQAISVKRNTRYASRDTLHKMMFFRTWPWYCYARSFKRLADIIAAAIVIILFAPAAPFVVLVIKMSSPGPVFFKDKRQGLHGKIFNCLKFRSMVAGADRIQDKLRIVSQVDGPQFKIEDDPRTNAVGRFLRDTYIDEIPQFINVLLGQMSVIGPRPSPESENTLCPYWRDARLSIRPGITGLWQVCRTRQPMKDFQEWIYYDTMYVRNLSLKTDIRICLKTVKKMIRNFIDQF